jgi:pyrroloquinoline quinone biosynthesis protein B
MAMEVVVLGSAAGGGFPQWNCNAPLSKAARDGSIKTKWRTQASIAVSADGDRWLLVNASPDLRQQLLQTKALWPRKSPRHSPIDAVLLTSGEIDHVAGLLSLRESQAFTLWATPRILEILGENAIFGALNPDFVTRQSFPLDQAFEPTGKHGPLGFTVTAFPVPGKVPLFMEGRSQGNLGGTAEETVGLEITARNPGSENGAARFHYIPGCARMTPELKTRLKGSALVFFDGTLWQNDELIDLGISPKTGGRMGHMNISGADGTLAAFADLEVQRKVFIHVNTTNPVLDEGSVERAEITAQGWDVAEDGMRIAL